MTTRSTVQSFNSGANVRPSGISVMSSTRIQLFFFGFIDGFTIEEVGLDFFTVGTGGDSFRGENRRDEVTGFGATFFFSFFPGLVRVVRM